MTRGMSLSKPLVVIQFAIDFPEVDQKDLNPVFMYANGVKIVDAHILL